MLVLGIETSCDETSVALVRDGSTLVGVATLSQVKTHEAYGGVVPEIASRMHVEHIHLLLIDLLNKHKIDQSNIDLIAATHCPGLMGALLVGVSFANALAYAWNKPILGINHLEGHIYGACMQNLDNLSFPACILLVSGGHTQLLLMKKIGSYQLLGNTLDDAVGEAFDKTATLLGLSYPGGPAIEKAAQHGLADTFPFPRAMTRRKNDLNFSFSGLKTAVRYTIQDLKKDQEKLTNQTIHNLAASFQKAAIETLLLKTEWALDMHPAKTLILCGGVAANTELKKQFAAVAKKRQVQLRMPDLSLCTDNAMMIAGLAYHKAEQAGTSIKTVKANAQIG